MFAKRVAEATDDKFQIQVFAAGEIVPGLQAADAVQNGTVEMCHTASYYYVGKDPTFAFGTAVPFGLNARQQNAWLYHGGGMRAAQRVLQEVQHLSRCPAATPARQMGGWFRKEIKTVADLNGLKMRIGGFAGRVLQKLGVVPQQIAGGDIYPALEKGTIDAAEWVGPYDDEKLGFNKVAPFYYYPGLVGRRRRRCTSSSTRPKWDELPKNYQAIVDSRGRLRQRRHAGASTTPATRRRCKRLVAGGAQLRPFPQEVLEACYKAANEALRRDLGQERRSSRRSIDAYMAFRDDEYLWWQVAEFTFDNFMIRARASG